MVATESGLGAQGEAPTAANPLDHDGLEPVALDLDASSWIVYVPELVPDAELVFEQLSSVLERAEREEETPPRASNRKQFYAAGPRCSARCSAIVNGKYRANPRYTYPMQ